MVVAPELLSGLNADQLRELVTDLIAQVARNDQEIGARNLQINALDQQIASLDQTISSKDREILYRQAKIDQLTHEMAVLKRLASLVAAANNLMLDRPVCLMKPSMPTSPLLSKSFKTWRHRPTPPKNPASNPSAQPYRQSCPALSCTTNPIAPPAPVAAS